MDFSMHTRRGVEEYITVSAYYFWNADYIVQLDSESCAALFLISVDLEQALSPGTAKLAKGDSKDVAGVFELFDKFVPSRNFKIPPLKDQYINGNVMKDKNTVTVINQERACTLPIW